MITVLLQPNPVSGDVSANARRLAELAAKAVADSTEGAPARGRSKPLCLAPAFSLAGPSWHPLARVEGFFARCRSAAQALALMLAEQPGGGPDLLLCAPGPEGRMYLLLSQGQVRPLPIGRNRVLRLPGLSLLIPDAYLFAQMGRTEPPFPIPPASPSADAAFFPECFPFHEGGQARRERHYAALARAWNLPVLAANLCGATEGVVYPGQSCLFVPQGPEKPGITAGRAPAFATGCLVLDVPRRGEGAARALHQADAARALHQADAARALHQADAARALHQPDAARALHPLAPVPEGPAPAPDGLAPAPEGPEALFRAAVLGVADNVVKTGFSGVIVGLSGGMDSSLVACIAAEALGPDKVLGVLMPSPWSSDHSVEDARLLAGRLGIQAVTVPIEGMMKAFDTALAPAFDRMPLRPGDLTAENIQARIRGVILMALANRLGRLVLATSNKSEGAVGYCTLYGDTVGSLEPIGDIYKTGVYKVARWYNDARGEEIIPERVFTKAPSAELRPGQTDQDSLPPYEVLDTVLAALLEGGADPATLALPGIAPETVRDIAKKLAAAEFKRHQTPPVLRMTTCTLGADWLMPVGAKVFA